MREQTKSVANRALSLATSRLRQTYAAEYVEIMRQLEASVRNRYQRRDMALQMLRRRHMRRWDHLRVLAYEYARQEVNWVDGRTECTNDAKVKWKPERAFDCPYCGQPAGRPCHTPSGNRLVVDHKARRALVKESA